MPSGQAKDILSRIGNGLATSLSELHLSHKKAIDTTAKLGLDHKYQYQQLLTEFEDYKEKNDIERNFRKNLEPHKRDSILQAIRELMQESTWHCYDRDLVDSQTPVDAANQLELVTAGNQLIKDKMMRIFQFSKDNEQALPSHVFAEQIASSEEALIAECVNLTSHAAIHFMDKQRKKMRHAASQTKSIQQLFDEFNSEIKDLKAKLLTEKMETNALKTQMEKVSENMAETQQNYQANKALLKDTES